MSSEQYYAPGADMPGFVQELMDFVGFTEADIEVIRRTAPALLKHERAITDALYEHFLKFPAAARFFLLPDGSPDQPRLERRKHSLGRWLRETAEAAMTHDFLYYLLAIGLSHSHRSFGPGGKIPPHLMVGAMSLAQSAFARIFRRGGERSYGGFRGECGLEQTVAHPPERTARRLSRPPRQAT